MDKYGCEAAALLFISSIPGVDIINFTATKDQEVDALKHFAVSSISDGGTPRVPQGAIHTLTGA